MLGPTLVIDQRFGDVTFLIGILTSTNGDITNLKLTICWRRETIQKSYMCVLLIMIIIVITDHQRRPEKSLFTHVVLESIDTKAKWQSQSFNIAIDPGDHRHDQRFESHLRWRSRSTP